VLASVLHPTLLGLAALAVLQLVLNWAVPIDSSTLFKTASERF
jgi:hypothetical protein